MIWPVLSALYTLSPFSIILLSTLSSCTSKWGSPASQILTSVLWFYSALPGLFIPCSLTDSQCQTILPPRSSPVFFIQLCSTPDLDTALPAHSLVQCLATLSLSLRICSMGRIWVLLAGSTLVARLMSGEGRTGACGFLVEVLAALQEPGVLVDLELPLGVEQLEVALVASLVLLPLAGQSGHLVSALLGSELDLLASDDPALDLPLAVADGLGAGRDGDVDQAQGVPDHGLLDGQVQLGVRVEGRAVVYLQQDGRGVVVQHYVKPQQLKAHVAGEVDGLAGPVVMADDGLPHDHRLHDDIVDLGLEGLDVDPLLVKALVDGGKRAFMALAEVGVVAGELVTVLVDGVVGEVHAHLGQVVSPGRLVLDGGEPGDALLVDVEAEGVAADHQHVDAQVELQVVDQVGPAQVTLHHVVLVRLELVQVAQQEDPAALAAGLRFHYVGPDLAFRAALHVGPQLGRLRWEQPRVREERVVQGKRPPQPDQAPGQMIFAGEREHPWKVVDLLVLLHPAEDVGLDRVVSPEQVPVGRLLVVLEPPAQLPADVADNGVLGVSQVGDDPVLLASGAVLGPRGAAVLVAGGVSLLEFAIGHQTYGWGQAMVRSSLKYRQMAGMYRSDSLMSSSSYSRSSSFIPFSVSVLPMSSSFPCRFQVQLLAWVLMDSQRVRIQSMVSSSGTSRQASSSVSTFTILIQRDFSVRWPMEWSSCLVHQGVSRGSWSAGLSGR